MFYGLASGAVKVDGIEVDQVLSDIETLNRAAFEGKYEVTAVSFNAYTHLVDKYALLPHGASMGDKYGPILVARGPSLPAENGGSLRGLKIGIPGTLTSAYLTLQMFDPDFTSEVMPFDEIQQAVADGRLDAGLLIHEGQLTYAAEGIAQGGGPGRVVVRENGRPAAAARRQHHPSRPRPELMQKVSKMLHDSIAHALNNRADAVEYAQQFGRGLDRKDTDKFVGMYVNQLTLDYGKRGRAALEVFFAEAWKKRLIDREIKVEFV
jgi:1,4-dihydroxy-6-naphthoate synthase